MDLISILEDDRSHAVYPMGMREMQHLAFQQRDKQYLLIKAPPASGKSRALMYLALDKLNNQGIRKVIVTVPERSIGSSFKNTNLTDGGFPYDWFVEDGFNLCLGVDDKKSTRFMDFLKSDGKILVCPHATFRNGVSDIDMGLLDNCLIAVDEFHHVSTNNDNVLGKILNTVIEKNSTTQIIAMTGSYIRGDGDAILTDVNEDMFEVVTYSYYEQLKGYKYLKGISFEYEFYRDSYIQAIKRNINIRKKTIIYVPRPRTVAAGEVENKDVGVDKIYGVLGRFIHRDEETCIDYIKAEGGHVLKVANFVNNEQKERDKYLEYAANLKERDDLDMIVSLNLAKEGFDWPCCEELIVVGYRDSPTEIIQIIGRVGRDYPGKEVGKFIYLIPRPAVNDITIDAAVNDMLKVNVLILLMEQVMEPKIHLPPPPKEGISIADNPIGATPRAMDILHKQNDTLIEAIIATCPSVKDSLREDLFVNVLRDIEVPTLLKEKFNDLNHEEIDYITGGLFLTAFLKRFRKHVRKWIEENGSTDGLIPDDGHGGMTFTSLEKLKQKFLNVGSKYINIDDYDLNLIKSINPFIGMDGKNEHYNLLSKFVNEDLLARVSYLVKSKKTDISDSELLIAYPQIAKFKETSGRFPSHNSREPVELRLALCYDKLVERKNIEKNRVS